MFNLQGHIQKIFLHLFIKHSGCGCLSPVVQCIPLPPGSIENSPDLGKETCFQMLTLPWGFHGVHSDSNLPLLSSLGFPNP